MRALGGRGKHIQISLCLSTIRNSLKHHYALPKPPSEHTQRRSSQRELASGLCEGGCEWFAKVRVTTKYEYESASVAVRAEKRATKSDKLIVLFSETETAKQN